MNFNVAGYVGLIGILVVAHGTLKQLVFPIGYLVGDLISFDLVVNIFDWADWVFLMNFGFYRSDISEGIRNQDILKINSFNTWQGYL